MERWLPFVTLVELIDRAVRAPLEEGSAALLLTASALYDDEVFALAFAVSHAGEAITSYAWAGSPTAVDQDDGPDGAGLILHCLTGPPGTPANGGLVDISDIARAAGFEVPMAVTSALWARCIEVPQTERNQSDTVRLWNLLWRLHHESPQQPGTPRVTFELHVKRHGVTERVQLVARRSASATTARPSSCSCWTRGDRHRGRPAVAPATLSILGRTSMARRSKR